MKITQEHLQEVSNIDLTKESHIDIWSDNLKECYEFHVERNFLRIIKFFGKYRDYSITETIDNYSKYNLPELNKQIKEVIKQMNEQSKNGGCHGMNYHLT